MFARVVTFLKTLLGLERAIPGALKEVRLVVSQASGTRSLVPLSWSRQNPGPGIAGVCVLRS